MRILKSGIFHQMTPPGPFRDILEQFSFVANFHGVIQVLKRLPGVPVTTKIMKLGKFRNINQKYLYRKKDAQFLIDYCFKSCSNGLKFEKNSGKSKKESPVSQMKASWLEV